MFTRESHVISSPLSPLSHSILYKCAGPAVAPIRVSEIALQNPASVVSFSPSLLLVRLDCFFASLSFSFLCMFSLLIRSLDALRMREGRPSLIPDKICSRCLSDSWEANTNPRQFR
ncbi:hypothetical protein Cni_G27410 [Canna indica]|uniref:Uncharacterized protein n=1 Tax=Canna indica TaxID=4628 RepID=A0AAQ3QRC6_9LILI|nr:hypothetical protein Cni_G27410 [Canna indica]